MITGKLSERRAKTALPKGVITRGPNKGQRRTRLLLNDGGGLYTEINITSSGTAARSWLFKYARLGTGRKIELGLGSLATVPLALARQEAQQCRLWLREGKDPQSERKRLRDQNIAAHSSGCTFQQAMQAYIAKEKHTWTNVVHAKQWTTSLEQHAGSLMRLDVRDIGTDHVLKALSPIWTTKVVTADRVRNRIENILAWSITAGHRTADNCARWAGHLEHLLASPADLRKAKGIKPQPSVPYQKLPEVMAKLRKRDTTAALAVEFLTLTAVRSADVIAAKRADIDHDDKVWRIKAFSKTGTPLDVPLSTRAYDIVQQVERLVDSPLLFARLSGQHLPKVAMHQEVIRIVGRGNGSPHGMRASIRSFCQDVDGVAREVAEGVLGHKVYGATEAAYARSDQLAKRRALLQRWSDYLAAPASHDVLPMQRRRRAS